LKVDTASSATLHKNYQDDQITQRLLQVFSRGYSRFDDDDWRRLRQGAPPGTETYMFRAFLDPALPEAASPDVIASIRRMIEGSQSFAEFQTAIRERIAALEEERRVIADRRLSPPVQTFSGIEDQIPQYIMELIRSIVAIKVLYLQERRRPIGGEEAQKILNLKTRPPVSEKLPPG
jgi:hypothetical protein